MKESCGSGTVAPTVFIENQRTRVTEWRFKRKGDNTGWHRHKYDYVIVPLFDGVLKIDSGEDEPVAVSMSNGVPYFRESGVEHDVINGNEFECAFVEIEFLQESLIPIEK